MSKPAAIQINMPNPCSQKWEDMATSWQDRFCTRCNNTIIDFTAYSDTSIYNFFSGNNGHVCGRFLGTQLDRNIHIPPQPHSHLYRLTVAFGLTLLFTQTPQLLAQTRPPIAIQNAASKQKDKTESKNTGTLRGRVTDNKKETLPSAVVQVFQNGVIKGGTATDYDGNYTINSLRPATTICIYPTRLRFYRIKVFDDQ